VSNRRMPGTQGEPTMHQPLADPDGDVNLAHDPPATTKSEATALKKPPRRIDPSLRLASKLDAVMQETDAKYHHWALSWLWTKYGGTPAPKESPTPNS
jgi:hypothetical protein